MKTDEELTLEYYDLLVGKVMPVWKYVDSFFDSSIYSKRIKSLESCIEKIRYYKEVKNIDVEIGDLCDIIGIRQICEDEKECYKNSDVLDYVFEDCISKKRRDYIEEPKETGYRAIHTYYKIDEVNVEAQFMTPDMEKFANSTHDEYKVGKLQEAVEIV